MTAQRRPRGKRKPATEVAHLGRDPKRHLGAVSTPVYRATTILFDTVAEMEAAGVDYQLVMYAGAVHAFTQREAGNDPATGAAYNAAADVRSWAQMQAFLAEIFD
jgi:cystathionine beta-lyase/cystathionine gamma-synthase